MNIRSGSVLYTFDLSSSMLNSTQSSSSSHIPRITCVASGSALDTVAIGCEDGKIYLLNLKFDRILFSLQQLSAVTSLSFRADGTPFLASSSILGDVFVWDLEKQRLNSTVIDASSAEDGSLPVVKCQFLPDEPVLLVQTSGNQLQVFFFFSIYFSLFGCVRMYLVLFD